MLLFWTIWWSISFTSLLLLRSGLASIQAMTMNSTYPGDWVWRRMIMSALCVQLSLLNFIKHGVTGSWQWPIRLREVMQQPTGDRGWDQSNRWGRGVLFDRRLRYDDDVSTTMMMMYQQQWWWCQRLLLMMMPTTITTPTWRDERSCNNQERPYNKSGY